MVLAILFNSVFKHACAAKTKRLGILLNGPFACFHIQTTNALTRLQQTDVRSHLNLKPEDQWSCKRSPDSLA